MPSRVPHSQFNSPSSPRNPLYPPSTMFTTTSLKKQISSSLDSIIRTISIAAIFTIALSSFASADPSIIHDKDGFTNVRRSPSQNSPIIYKIHDNEVFETHSYGKKGNWVPITYLTASGKPANGYIHSSRILPLIKLRIEGKQVTFKVKLVPFKKSNHQIKMSSPGNDGSIAIVETIDGQEIWGGDGMIPTTEVASIKIKINGTDIPVTQSLFSNLYDMTPQPEMIARKGNTYFIVQSNSDGAGYYQCTWVISDLKPPKLYTFTPEGG